MTPPRKPVLGLIGAIGAGKSTAAEFFAEFGGAVVDCDKLGHAALGMPEVVRELRKRWGLEILNANGSPNRRAIAAIVFERPDEREWLEKLLFPIIDWFARERIEETNRDSTKQFTVLDAAVLLEAGWAGNCDKIVYIDAPRELRLQRLMPRSGWTEADLDARESAQWPAERKKKMSDLVVRNDGTPEHLRTAIGRVLSDWNGIEAPAMSRGSENVGFSG